MPDRPFITQRLWKQHRNPAELDVYLSLLERQRGACDEVWFATDYGFPPLAVHQANAQRMMTAAARVRGAGMVASLQISNTLGHGDYLKHLDFGGITWQRMVGHEGTVAPYSNCPRDPAFHTYLDALARSYCAWQPASVWIDDDLRMGNHSPVGFGCFCDRCVAAFNAETRGNWTRGSLVRAINEGNDLSARRAWLEFGRQSLAMVAGVIATAVKAVAPECRMGLQHCDPCWGAYNGPDWTPVFETLARISGKPAGSRPGGGFYADHNPREMVTKALFVGLQNSRLPSCVDDIRDEVENLPGAVTGKSARGTVLESSLALAYGNNGLTYTPLMFTHEEVAWHERVLAEIAAWRPFWLRYCAASRGTHPAGLAIALSRCFTDRLMSAGEPPFTWASCNMGQVAALTTVGLPLTWGSEGGNGVLLHPHAVDGMNAGQLHELAGQGVITDGETLLRLQRRGFGALLPVKAAAAALTESDLCFTADSLNGAYSGQSVGLISLSSAFPSCSLEVGDTARILARYAHADGTPGAPATVALETAAGGRWVVFGGGCWSSVMTTAQRAQLLAVADWVSPGGLPVLLETPGQVVVVPRVDGAGRVCSVMLLNCSLDATAPSLRLRVRRGCGTRATWCGPIGDPMPVALPAIGTSEAFVELPGLPPWGVGALLVGEGQCSRPDQAASR